MTFKGHLVVGASCSIATFSAFKYYDPQIFQNVLYPLFFLLISISLIASLLPDIDTPKSYIGIALPFISYPLSAFVKHRGITHTLLMGIGLSIFLYYILIYYNLSNALYVSIFFFVGYFSHLIADSMTTSGVSILYPISKKFFHILPKSLRFKTGEFAEYMYIIFLVILDYFLCAKYLF